MKIALQQRSETKRPFQGGLGLRPSGDSACRETFTGDRFISLPAAPPARWSFGPTVATPPAAPPTPSPDTTPRGLAAIGRRVAVLAALSLTMAGAIAGSGAIPDRGTPSLPPPPMSEVVTAPAAPSPRAPEVTTVAAAPASTPEVATPVQPTPAPVAETPPSPPPVEAAPAPPSAPTAPPPAAEGPSAPSTPVSPASQNATPAAQAPIPGRVMYENLHLGSHGQDVENLQRTLVKWMPSWKPFVEADGVYGEKTAQAVAAFSEIYGFEKGGGAIGPRAGFALRDIDSGEFWKRDAKTDAYPYKMAPNGPTLYGRAMRGYPFDEALSLDTLRQLAKSSPSKMVKIQGYSMQARAAYPLERLRTEMKKHGYAMHVTCTTEGQHASWEHPAGRAVDFAVLYHGVYIDDLGASATRAHSERVTSMAARVGLRPLNEYHIKTTFSTGPHIHVAI